MPAQGLNWLPKPELLTDDELVRLVRVLAEMEVRTVRLTGGEPLLRPGLPMLVARLSQLDLALSLTTNGLGLARQAQALRDAGLRRVNVSLDTLHTERFSEMTRRDELTKVLDGIDAAIDAGFDPVKINAVIERGVNDGELLDLAVFGRQRGVEIRFIEFMPLDAQGEWGRQKVVSQDEIVDTIGSVFPLERVTARGAAPADRWRYLDGKGLIGVIPTVTKAFCGDCDRVRLTADGQFRTCLFAIDETDLRAALRRGDTDDEMAGLIERAVGAKWAGHQINQVNFLRPRRSMSQIGG